MMRKVIGCGQPKGCTQLNDLSIYCETEANAEIIIWSREMFCYRKREEDSESMESRR